MVNNNTGLINDLVKDYTENKEIETKKPFDVKAQLVRYKGGETEKDDEGKTFTQPAFSIGPIKSGAQVPIKAKPGEPENGYEWAEDAAQMSWNTGNTIDEIEKKLGKKWPLAQAQIDNDKVEINKWGDEAVPKYHRSRRDPEGTKYFESPKAIAEEAIGRRYGFRPVDEVWYAPNSGPSWASRVLKKINQQDNWNNFINGRDIQGIPYKKGNDYDSLMSWLNNHYVYLNSVINKLSVAQSTEDLKKLGVEDKTQLNQIVNYLNRSLNAIYNNVKKNINEEFKKNEQAKQEKAEPVKADVPKTDNKVEATNEEHTEVNENKPTETDAPNEEQVDNKVEPTDKKVEATPDVDATPDENAETDSLDNQLSYDNEAAKVNYELSEQERIAQNEAEEIANREMTEQEAADLDKKIDEAARKRLQDQFDYEDWLKNPTIISGIFGKSGLSIAKRIGLGLSTLFAIFSDVARNYGKGINNNTDFKNDAMAELYKTIGTIQDKRANAAGEMAAGYYQSTTENDKQLNESVVKMKRLPIASYVPETAMRIFAQESIINPEAPLSNSLYNQVVDESRNGFINSVKKNKKLKNVYLDDRGNLTPAGEVKFLEKEKNVLDAFKNVMSISDARMANINKLLDLDQKKADTRKKVHDVNYSTNMDYINAENSINAEITSLEESKLKYTEAATLDLMLNLANENRKLAAGLSTSNSLASESETNNEAILNRFQEQKGLEEVNEELAKHGWQAEIGADVKAKFPFNIVPISGEIEGGLKWTSEQANKHLQSKYDKFVNDDQRSTSKARTLSNITGQNVDDFTRDIVNWLQTEKAKGTEADFNKVRQDVIQAIDNRIEQLRDIYNELDDMKKRETRFDTRTETNASINPYISMFNDVPSKNNNWYRHRLSLT